MPQKVTTVLLIDDDLAINYFHKRLFIKLELAATVLPYYNSFDALEALLFLNKSLLKNDVVLIFLDLNMPGMDGWSFLKEYEKIHHSINCNIKIFVLSASINPDDVLKAKQNPFITDYFPKPLNAEEIILIKELYL